MINRITLIFIYLLIQELAFGQKLLLKNYTQKEYGTTEYATSPQNWDMEQDSLGRLYIANSDGAFLFDGFTWSMIPGTEGHTFYSLSKSNDHVIYAGGINELGFFKCDSIGKVIFESLTSLMHQNNIIVDHIYQVISLTGSVYFRNRFGLIRIQGDSVDLISDCVAIETESDSIVIQDYLGHLLKIRNYGYDTLYSFGKTLKSRVVSIFNLSNTKNLLFTEEDGIFNISGNQLIQWNINNSKSTYRIKAVKHYPLLKLFCVATSNNGILLIDYDGNIVNKLGTDQGMISNTCYNVFQDNNNELWACLDKGISKIGFPTQLSFSDYTNGLDGVVYCMISNENTIFAGTTAGFYYLDEENQFQKMPISTSIWDVKEIEGVIWVASSIGIFTVKNKFFTKVKDISANALELSDNHKRIWVGLNDGLGFFQKKGSIWIWRGKVKGVNHEVRTIAEESDSVIWASYTKVSRIVFNSNQSTVVSVQEMTEENDFSEDFLFIESYKVKNQIVFGTGKGIFSFDYDSNKFVHNPAFGTRFTDSKHEAWAMAEDADHNVWLTSNRTTGKLIFEDSQMQSWDTLAFARLNSTDVWRIVPAENGFVYFCTTDGLFQYDPRVNKKYDNEYYTLINKIEINRDSVISYLETDNSGVDETLIPFISNDIRFNYTATSYNSGEKIQFSYILEGFDDAWSSWVTESIKEYTNLPHGDYTFRVKAKNLYGIESKTASYIFSISPPWHRTYWAYTIYLLLFVTLVIVAERIQRKRLFKRQQARIKIQKKKLEQEREISNKLRQVDKLKDEFLANTSHELRTPLNGIIGISESLYEESEHIDEREAKNNLAMVIASGKRLASMIDSILDYSKLKTKNLEIRKKPVDLKSIANLVLEMSRPLVSKNDLSLINNLLDDLPLLDADENRLQQILYNLIGNAIKFTPKGTISISAIPKGEFVEIEVRDEGIGIPEEKLKRIFDSYEQVDVDENREFIGTGLGLTITKKLVELHNGSISVESKLGVGSSFKFTIPISLQASSLWIETPFVHMEDTIMTPSVTSSEDAQFNILIVDDEQINRQVLANHLKHEPYNLELASNGKEALKAMEQKQFDLVLLDVMMPVMSGFDVCLKIRDSYLISELPVIFITAKDQIIDLVEGLKYGGNDYITKPFSKQEFLARIKTHLNLHKVNESFFRFVPIEFLQSLGSESILDVNLGDQTEKEVTVFFSDIRDYTTLSEEMTPKDNFEFLNSFLGRMGPVIQDNKGFVLQFLGDGLMSIFLHDPMDAVKASIAMQSKVEEYNIERESKSRRAIKVGIGIHSGKLILGILGDKKRMSVNVVSDSVNTASRMEGLTKHYGASIIMSEHTLYGLIGKNTIHYRFIGLVKVKGKSKPLKIFEVLDGISSKENQTKIETKETFETGLSYYFNKEFIHAATEFKKVIARNKKDVSAQMYLKLSAKYMVEGVPEHWNGEETMLLK